MQANNVSIFFRVKIVKPHPLTNSNGQALPIKCLYPLVSHAYPSQMNKDAINKNALLKYTKIFYD